MPLWLEGRASLVDRTVLMDGDTLTGAGGIANAADVRDALGLGNAALQDYEVGTWIPSLAFGGVSTGITYNSRLGYYTKIGNIVHSTGILQLTSKGTAVGTATISGLPFVSSSSSQGGSGGMLQVVRNFVSAQEGYPFLRIDASASLMVMSFYDTVNDTDISTDNAKFTDTTRFNFTIWYRAS